MKLSKEGKKQAVEAEAKNFLSHINENVSNPSQLISYIYEVLEEKSMMIHSATLSLIIVQIKALFSALSQTQLPPEFLSSINTHKKAFILSAESLEMPHDDSFDHSKYWLIPLIYYIRLILEAVKLLKRKKVVDADRKIASAFKPLLSKNFELSKFATRLQQLPLGTYSPELLYLTKTAASLLLGNITLLSPLMDMSVAIPHLLARMPFESLKSKLRDKVVRLYEAGQFNTESVVTNTLEVLGAAVPDKDPAVKKRAEISMINMFYLIKAIEKGQAHIFSNTTKRVIMYFSDSKITLIIVRLLKIPPLEHIRDTLIAILLQCVQRTKYSLLLDLLKEHNIVEVLLGHSKFPEAQFNVIVLLQFFLIGYQASPEVFHNCIPGFERILGQVLKSDGGSKFCAKIVELLTIMLKLFTGYPVQYAKLIQLMNEVREKFKLETTPEEEISKAIRMNNWFYLTQQVSGFGAPISYQPVAVNLKHNAEGYKGLANMGNSTSFVSVACYMNVIIQALFFSLKFRADVLSIDQKKYNEVAQARPKEMKMPQSPLMQLQKIFALLLKSTRAYITPKDFRCTLPENFRKSFTQQDASEFFKAVSDLLELDAKGLHTPNLFTKHFEGTMKIKIKCMDCNTATCREEKFVDLYIPIDSEAM